MIIMIVSFILFMVIMIIPSTMMLVTMARLISNDFDRGHRDRLGADRGPGRLVLPGVLDRR